MNKTSNQPTNLNVVYVKFEVSAYNYHTNVSPTTTEKQARDYFVGTSFNMGAYPHENFRKCIDIEFTNKNK